MEVVWSNNALLSAQAAADYAREEFGDFQVRKLREKIRLAIRRISSMPSSCPLEQNLQNIDSSIQYRYITLFPHLEMIFHEEMDSICVIDLIWNTRRNPNSLQKGKKAQKECFFQNLCNKYLFCSKKISVFALSLPLSCKSVLIPF